MSGIAGVWNLDGRPAERDAIGAIGSAIAHRGKDYAGIWCGGAIGLAAHVHRVTPESIAERQPLTDAIGNTLVFDGRLDNREDLLLLMPSKAVASGAPDAAVVFETFRTWGTGCFHRLIGDFALAVFDARGHRLALARDPVGCRPLYYWTDGKTLVFGSEIKAVLAHPHVRAKPNEDLLADFFLRDHLPYEDEGETFFAGVQAVLPGHSVNISTAGIRSERFWDFNPQNQVRYGSYGDYTDRFSELLTQAVKRRLRTNHPVAIAASGGLDSSIVLCIADDLRKRGEAHVPLLPVSYAGHEDPPTEEMEFIRLLESTRRLRIDRLAIGSPGDRQRLETLAWHSEWPRFDDGWCAQLPMLEWANAHNARILLTGHWSDQFLFTTGYLTDLFVRLAWGRIAGHLKEYTRWFVDANPAYFQARFRRELFLNLTPHVVRAWLRPCRGPRAQHSSEQLVTRELAARLTRRRVRVPRPRPATAHARDIYQTVRAKSHRLQFEADEKLAASVGIDSATPFLDRDLIAYLMSIPGDIQNRGGVPRALLRDSMRGRVPDAILRRRWRDDGAEVTRERQKAYLSSPIALEASKTLGFLKLAPCIDRETVDFIGLEFWSRVFFSDRLTPPQPSSDEAGKTMDTAVTSRKDDREKLPYSPPRLTVHGDLRTITAAKQSDRSEAGQPKTFSSGMP